MLSDAKTTEKKTSSRYEGELTSLDSFERSDDSNEDDDKTGAKNNNFYGNRNGDGDGGGDRYTGAEGGYSEWLGFLSPSALFETVGAMAKAKASSSTKSRKNQSWENVRIK